MPLEQHADILERLYRRLNRRRYVHPDPLEFLYNYDCPRDREIVALIASSLAYGRVRQILKSVSAVLERLGPRPARHLAKASPSLLRRALSGFRHRFNSGGHVAAMLAGAKRIAEKYGSLEACFRKNIKPGDETVLPAMQIFVSRIKEAAEDECGHLLPDPARRSAATPWIFHHASE